MKINIAVPTGVLAFWILGAFIALTSVFLMSEWLWSVASMLEEVLKKLLDYRIGFLIFSVSGLSLSFVSAFFRKKHGKEYMPLNKIIVSFVFSVLFLLVSVVLVLEL